MLRVLRLPAADLQRMGQASRELAVTKFDEKLVLAQYLAAVAEVPPGSWPIARVVQH